jgi:hypothetical protein
MPEIISRKEAIERGLKRYFTGKMCGRGHFSERQASDGKCCECSHIAHAQWRQENKDRALLYARNWRANNPEKAKLQREKYKPARRQQYIKNRETHLERHRIYRAVNNDDARRLEKRRKIEDMIAVLRDEMPELLKEFGL